MIEISFKIEDNHICHTSYIIEGFTTLNDVALVLLELELVKQRLLDESDNYEPIMELKE